MTRFPFKTIHLLSFLFLSFPPFFFKLLFIEILIVSSTGPFTGNRKTVTLFQMLANLFIITIIFSIIEFYENIVIIKSICGLNQNQQEIRQAAEFLELPELMNYISNIHTQEEFLNNDVRQQYRQVCFYMPRLLNCLCHWCLSHPGIALSRFQFVFFNRSR